MKTDKDIENLLMSGKKVSLSTHEKANIKSVLLDHATQTLKHERLSIPSPWTSWVMRGAVSFASLLIVFVGTAFASQDSLPGEPLYAMKVHVVEEMVSLTKLNLDDKISYDVLLMETRLSEIKTLVLAGDIIEPDDLNGIALQIAEHVDEITTAFEDAEENEVSNEEKIETLSKLTGIIEAQEEVAETSKDLGSLADKIHSSQQESETSLMSAVEDFVDEESPETVSEYLSDQIAEVGTDANATTTDEVVRDGVESYLNEVSEYLIEGSTTNALDAILEAQQIIDTDEYINEVSN